MNVGKLANIIKQKKPQWPKPIKLIGQGSFGAVFNTNNGRVMKISGNNTTEEFKMLRRLHNVPFVPHTKNGNMIVFNLNTGRRVKNIIRGYGTGSASAFIMNKVGGAQGMTLENYLQKFPNAKGVNSYLTHFLTILGEKGIKHGNLHEGNIIVTANSAGRITGMWIIDFGMANVLSPRQVNEISWKQIELMLMRPFPSLGPKIMRRRVNVAKNLKQPKRTNLKHLGRSQSAPPNLRTSRRYNNSG